MVKSCHIHVKTRSLTAPMDSLPRLSRRRPWRGSWPTGPSGAARRRAATSIRAPTPSAAVDRAPRTPPVFDHVLPPALRDEAGGEYARTLGAATRSAASARTGLPGAAQLRPAGLRRSAPGRSPPGECLLGPGVCRFCGDRREKLVRLGAQQPARDRAFEQVGRPVGFEMSGSCRRRHEGGTARHQDHFAPRPRVKRHFFVQVGWRTMYAL